MKYLLYCVLATSLLPSAPTTAQSVPASAATSATTYTVQGRVTNRSNGQGLPGVTVLVKGTSIGVSTTADGSYSIQVPKQAKALVFSTIGFIQQEVKLTGQPIINVGLASDSQQLSEVVVTGMAGKAAGISVRVRGNSLGKRKERQAPASAPHGYSYPAQPEPGAGESYATIYRKRLSQRDQGAAQHL
ncbi:hypothetical protein HMJ29_07130 [Hymenobacter taeanensis]|uniref:Carboxypeptidase-like regulatory domain-containing protein n=1 Tax=Hymenobacter taeanensis TaxID=2735321 RepID=A0A6M6BFJ3_9BACT|nr:MULTISPECIES: carboxypeptidase-like regulatory domain-containing protein [Hymenobacter]QJX46722.1 hypothetical protein HMJ29_07130 [Hymenobacter taeanensis]UOQ80590.1 carboxypeptidase-like regulatory domain-containing protein [Hymenobacter sp. 5414T-23]